uniref:Uncharacterized protein n=1 Tax=Arundo donax TaxID=35708 RepID=A0A0A9U7G4_ARUDO
MAKSVYTRFTLPRKYSKLNLLTDLYGRSRFP